MKGLFILASCYLFVQTSAWPLHGESHGFQERANGAMLEALTAMEMLMTGQEVFDAHFYSELRSCMATFDTQLPLSQDRGWQGIIDYWDMGGSSSDRWGQFPSHYFEHNITESSLHGMLIVEPCDYASNVAYYHGAIEICMRRAVGKPFSFPKIYVDSIGKGFSALAMGSAFWHGSNTLLGRQQDRKTLAVLAYALHQASLSGLTSQSPIIHDLSKTKRDRTALELIDAFQDMYINVPVTRWYDTTEQFDIPDYMMIYAGLFSTVLTLGFDNESVDMLIPILADAFKLPEDLRRFLLDEYIPEIRKATSHIHLTPPQHAAFFSNSIGTVMKLIFAFLWQERVLTKNKLFLDPVVNFIGFELLPRVNFVADQLTSFEYYDPDFQNGTNIYPGDVWCNPLIPHAKWHLESAIGLLDLTYLSDEICALLTL